MNSTGTFTSVFQANGTATFDGLNKVAIQLSADTLSGVGAPLNESGTYSVQANCLGQVNLTSGGTASFSLVVYNQGNAFLVTGSDATYSYGGGGNTQPASACTAAKLTGPYVFNATGYVLGASSASGVADAVGTAQFDGVSAVTVAATVYATGAAPSTLSLAGKYSMASSCLGTATLTDSQGHSYSMSLSVSAASATAVTGLDLTLAQASKTILSGAGHPAGQPAGSAASCTAAMLTGTYAFSMNGRALSSAGAFTGSFQSNGTATFDGVSKVTLTVTSNTNLAAGKQTTYTGTYTLPASCSGTLTINSPGAITFSLVAWNAGNNFNLAGADATYAYTGAGSQSAAACANASLSGTYGYTTAGFTLNSGQVSGTGDEAGLLQFDGQGNVTDTYTITSGGTSTQSTATGTYSVTQACLGQATLNAGGKSISMTFALTNALNTAFNLLEADGQFVRSGTAHASFFNPDQAIGNVASYVVDATPPGSVFVLYGSGLALKAASATSTPLPNTLLATSVTVNGEPAPLFYADPGQIDAQMPWDIPGNTVATVIVKNGNVSSNAAAVYVPATGTPGISVVVNADGSLNSRSAGAAVGEEVVAYFTGGGPVNAGGKLVTGQPAPNGLSPVTGNVTVTVNGVQAVVKYVGLTPQGVGLYQANFIVPQVSKGTYPVVITIAGQPSNNPVMTVTN